MNGLLVIISAYLDNADDYIRLLLFVKKSKHYDLVLINDNDKYQIDGFINNKKNQGKYFNVLSHAKLFDSKYFLTLDPDDILKNNIDWNKLEDLSKKIDNYNTALLINSFFFQYKDKIKFKKTPRHIFNPNTIYKTEIFKNINIEYAYINYMEDLAIVLQTLSVEKTISRINIPFYTYHYGEGISSDKEKTKYSNDIRETLKILESSGFKINNTISFYIFITRILRLKRISKKINSYNNNDNN